MNKDKKEQVRTYLKSLLEQCDNQNLKNISFLDADNSGENFNKDEVSVKLQKNSISQTIIKLSQEDIDDFENDKKRIIQKWCKQIEDASWDKLDK